MAELIPDEGRPPVRPNPVPRVVMWGAVVGVVSILGLAYHGWSTRAALNERIAGIERVSADRLSAELLTIRNEHRSVASDVAAVTERVGANAEALDTTRATTETLSRAHAKTAKMATANAEAVKAVQEDTDAVRKEAEARLATVDTKVAGVSSEMKTVASGLAAARVDLADTTRRIDSATAATTALSKQVERNVMDLSELRRRGERDFVEFDIRKGSNPTTWTVGDVRVELRKTDVGRSKYDVILHVDDRRLEKKDRTVNEPVPFLVGSDRLRYELVVIAVDRDRIRGYVSMPKGGTLSAARSTAP